MISSSHFTRLSFFVCQSYVRNVESYQAPPQNKIEPTPINFHVCSLVLRFHIGKVEQSIVPVPTEPERAVEPWRNEPKDLNELLENYIIENKFPSSIAGGMLYLTRSETRSGEKIDLIDDQKSKLFFDPCLRISWGSAHTTCVHLISLLQD